MRGNFGTGRLRTGGSTAVDYEILFEGIPPDDKGVFDLGSIIEIHMRPNAPGADAQLDDNDRSVVLRFSRFDGPPASDRQGDFSPPVLRRQIEFNRFPL